jgi:hypothetical protein
MVVARDGLPELSADDGEGLVDTIAFFMELRS